MVILIGTVPGESIENLQLLKIRYQTSVGYNKIQPTLSSCFLLYKIRKLSSHHRVSVHIIILMVKIPGE